MSRGRGGGRRNKSFGRRGQGKPKRKQYNLMTIRQKNDMRAYGEKHPVETEDTVKHYTKVEDVPQKAEPEEDSSSTEDSEEEEPVIKQLMAEIGVKEVEPESEQEDENEEDGEDDDKEEDEDLDSEDLDDEEEEEDLDDDVDEVESDDDAPLKKKRKTMQEEEEDSNDDDDIEDSVKQKSHVNGKDSEQQDSSDDDQDSEKGKKEKTMVDAEVEDDYVEDEDEGGSDEEELVLKESDPFTQHFELERDISDIAENKEMKWKKEEIKMPGFGESILMYKDAQYLPEPQTESDLHKLHVKQRLCSQARITNTELAHVSLKDSASLTKLQQRLFRHINSYQDLLYPKQDFHNLEEIRFVYCLHAVNHILKTRSRVIAHNAKLKLKKDNVDDDVEYRDQGLTRPKVLILLPYRDRALKLVKMIISLLSATQQATVSNQKRFESEFSELEDSDITKSHKPEDFQKMFEGNTDDNFRVGLSVSKKSLRLYSPFYDSDLIIASPLGLRTIIGLEGDKERDFDFLSSIEVLIVDQTDVYQMQNWDHFTHVFKHLHLQPKESHGVDFSRVRMWAINGWSQHFRQTLIFTSVILPEIMTIFNKSCHNYAGKLLVQRDVPAGTIKASACDAPQIFHRVPCDSPDYLSQRQAKLEYLKKKIIPYHTSAGMKQTLIYCNYYSFVTLRNYFREAEVDFLFINEYDNERHIRNTRIHFRKRHPHFMLYTERLHFHYRFRLRAIHHIVWFDLPQYPNFYPELVNLMETAHQACTTTALFTKYEGQKLMEIVGKKQAAHILNSEKGVNMITVS